MDIFEAVLLACGESIRCVVSDEANQLVAILTTIVKKTRANTKGVR